MRARLIDFALFALLVTAIAIAGGNARAANWTASAATPAPSTTPAFVVIRNSIYYPASITVKVGETVSWRNDDLQYSHTVTSTTNLFNSGNMDRGVAWSHAFAKAGKYPYTCKYHPFMQGTVIVEGGSPAPGSPGPAGAAATPAAAPAVGTAAPTTNPGGY